ncbi:leucine-rich repeat-containing protein 23-like [Schistocerca piceifrons]|uniref:leucine-rich repeat-containing protein 23-like n=1 Tax=Schistocerca piceifrons TaxID=274613 RepID=UPI001F5E4EC7|nr:leucine-rich repeat-containing protein 23-like [Schistocerca piceifrons]
MSGLPVQHLHTETPTEVGAGEPVPEEEPEEVLTCEQASAALSHLGKAADGLRYAYLAMRLPGCHLCDISAAAAFQNILLIDVSNNRLRDGSLDVLAAIPFLVMIKAENNLLESAAMPAMPYLQLLILNGNRITHTHGIEHPLLECLELSHNQIRDICSLEPDILKRLRTLDLRANALTSTAGIQLPTLENLYLAQNSIQLLEDLQSLTSLRVLHLRQNPLRLLMGFSNKMAHLTYLNLRGCKIEDMSELKKLACLPVLETIVISENPMVEAAEEEYRVSLLSELPRLKRIDKLAVEEEELMAAEELIAARTEVLEGEDEQVADEEDEI